MAHSNPGTPVTRNPNKDDDTKEKDRAETNTDTATFHLNQRYFDRLEKHIERLETRLEKQADVADRKIEDLERQVAELKRRTDRHEFGISLGGIHARGNTNLIEQLEVRIGDSEATDQEDYDYLQHQIDTLTIHNRPDIFARQMRHPPPARE